MSYRLAPEAVDEFSEALKHRAARSPASAIKLEEKLFDVIQLLERGGFDGQPVRLRSGARVRRWPLYPLPYWIYYERQDSLLVILRIFHQARKPIERSTKARRRD